MSMSTVAGQTGGPSANNAGDPPHGTAGLEPAGGEEPGDDVPWPTGGRRWREAGWWALIVAMAAVDAVGFWIILTLVIPKHHVQLLGLLVAGCTLAAVALPHQVGAVLRARRDGYPGSIAFIAFCSVVWLILGLAMAFIRLTTPDGARQAAVSTTSSFTQAAAQDPLLTEGMVVAGLLACLYLATGAVAGRHAWESGGRPEAEERRLHAHWRSLTRRIDRERYEQQVARRRREQAASDLAQLGERRDLHFEANDAAADQIAYEARVEMARRTGDAAATDALTGTPLVDAAARPLRSHGNESNTASDE